MKYGSAQLSRSRSGKRSGGQRLRRSRLELLEERCVLDGSAWFAEVSEPAAWSAGSEWIVQLTPKATGLANDATGAEAVLRTTGNEVSVVRGLGLPGMVLVRTGLSAADAEMRFTDNPLITSFEPNRSVGAQLLPDDPEFTSGALYGLENDGQFGVADADIDAPAAWDLTTGDPSVVVGVIDSGLTLDHPDLYLNVWIHQGEIESSLRANLTDTDGDSLITFRDLNHPANTAHVADSNTNGYIDAHDLLADPNWADGLDNEGNGFIDDLFGWDFVGGGTSPQSAGDNDPTDEHGHGTHVTGTIAATGDNGIGVTGITWSTSVMPLRFLDENRSGQLADAIAAINYATMMRSQFGVNMPITNNSWGYRGEVSESLRAALDANAAAGMLFVSAAGNGDALGLGIDNDADPGFAFYPASDPLENIISVAATDSRDRLARFSNFGATTVDIAAPGVGILSTDPLDQGNGGYTSRSGTSMAAPLVAGVAALIWAENPAATAAEVKAAILDEAAVDPLTTLTGQVATGGRLNAIGALSVDRIAPRAEIIELPNVDGPGIGQITFSVMYTDNRELNDGSITGNEILVADTFDGSVLSGVTLVDSVTSNAGKQIDATYRLTIPGGTFEDGDYQVSLKPGQVFDEQNNAASATVLGTFNADTTPNLIRAGDLEDTLSAESLRGAILLANGLPTANTIRLTAGTYHLSLDGSGDDATLTGDLDVQRTLTIKGAGAERTIIDAASLDRVLHVLPGAVVELRDLSISGGSAANGGGILVEAGGSLALHRVMVHDNEADNGGGIFNEGTLEVYQSTIHHNTASSDGGGLFNAAGASATLENSTVSTNAADAAAGISNAGWITIHSSTIATNESLDAGAGVVNHSGTLTLANTIIAGNTNSADTLDVAGQVNSLGFNLIESPGTSSGWTNDDLLDIDPNLGPLQFNGGNVETVSVWTHDLFNGSPAIDSGNNTLAPAIDQRGIPRPLDANADLIATVDIGAVEKFFGSVAGKRFLDGNENGAFDTGETALGGLIVYIDLNFNEQYEAGEPLAITDANGDYEFTGLAPGNYSIVDLPQPGWRQIRPTFGDELELISRGSETLQANADSSSPAISADGRFVAFSSSASNLSPNDINFARDVFLYDSQLGALELISVNAAGLPGNGDSYNPAISADGSIIVFESTASNLDPLGIDTDAVADIYAYDRTTGILALVSDGDGASTNPAISGDGRYIAFDSLASNLVENDTNQSRDVFVYDRQSGTVERVSVTSSGGEANFHSTHPAISFDGQFVAFESQAQNLDSTGLDVDSSNDIYIHDRSTGTTELISIGMDLGQPAEANNPSSSPVLSGDGRYVAFRSFATNLVADDNNSASDVFVYDRQNDAMQIVSVTDTGGVGSGNSQEPTISSDGQWIAFRSDAPLAADDQNNAADVYLYDLNGNSISRATSGSDADSFQPAISADGNLLVLVSSATNLIDGDTNDRDDIFVIDLAAADVQRVNTSIVSVIADGPSAGDGISESSALSHDGRYVAFSSAASNLIAGDTNGHSDIFIHDRATGSIELISMSVEGTPADGDSHYPTISADGRYVAFESLATNLVADDLNNQSDIFVYDRDLQTLELVSMVVGGDQGDGGSFRPAISANGNLVAFESVSTNLDSEGIDTNSDRDIYAYDRTAATIELISRGTGGVEAKGGSHSPSVSGDGNHIVFSSTASNLAADAVDLNSTADVYLYQRSSRNTTLISAGIGGNVGLGTVLYSADMTSNPGWTLDGGAGGWEYGQPLGNLEDPSSGFTGPNVIGFNLAGGYPPGLARSFATTPAIDVSGHDALVLQFQRHLAVEQPLFSRAGIEVSADGGSWLSVWQNEGFVTDFDWQLVTYELPVEQATSIRIRWYLESENDAFELGGWNIDDVLVGAATTTPAAADGASLEPTISADGQTIAYVSTADNLVENDPTTGLADVYLFDRLSSTTERIASTVDPMLGGFGEGVSLSADGRYLAFASAASDLVTGDTNREQDVFVHDRHTGAIEKASQAPEAQASGASGRPVLSGNGRYVSFRSEADNLTPSDLNFAADVFVAPTSAIDLRAVSATVTPGGSVEGIDLGNKPGTGTIRGRLFQDENQDGTRQASEGSLIGWSVYLDTNENGELDPGEPFRVTNSFGEYEFAGLLPLETYHLRAVAQSFWAQTTPRLTVGGVHVIALAAGALEDNRDFGFHFRGPDGQSLNEISGTYFLDANRNGIRDAGEQPLSGGVVYLDENRNGMFDSGERSEMTDAAGNYRFTGLPVGSYVVRIVHDANLTRTQPLNNALPPQTIAGSIDTTQGLASGDFNGDTFEDIVVASGDGIFVQLNDKLGGFHPPIRTPGGVGAAGAYTVVTGKFDSDNLVDLAFTNRLTNNITVMLGNGDGTFQHSANYVVGVWPHGLTTGDFDRDGRTDLAVGTETFSSTPGTVQVLYNAGTDGSFAPPHVIHSAVGTNVYFLQAVQLTDDNLDGLINASDAIDLAVVNFDRLSGGTIQPGNVTLLYNGTSGFTTSIVLPAGGGPAAVAAGDFDADGDPDLAVANFASDSVSIYQNVGNGSLVKLPGNIAVGTGPFAVTSADVDGDGDADLIAAGSAGSRLVVLRNITGDDGTLAFAPAETYGSGAFPRAVSSSVSAADFDRDGLPDLAIAYNNDGAQIENRTGNVEVYYNAVFPGGYEVQLNGVTPAPALEFGVATAATANVVGRHVFYNNSLWDGNNAGANAADDAAIATDKIPLMPGGQASLANYTNDSRGINGVMIDIANLPSGVALDPAADFDFRLGNDNDPENWPLVEQLPTVSVRRGAGEGGSARVTLTWPDGTIVGGWLKITVKATASTGLGTADVFYFGNAPGDVGNSAENVIVNGSDYVLVRAHPQPTIARADIRNPYDLNRDGLVDDADFAVVLGNAKGLANTTRLIELGTPLMPKAEGEETTGVKYGETDSAVNIPESFTKTKTNRSLQDRGSAFDPHSHEGPMTTASLDTIMATYAIDKPTSVTTDLARTSAAQTIGDPLDLEEILAGLLNDSLEKE